MMKKLITVILIMALVLPAAALSEDYAPALGMTIQEFISAYNSIGAPLGSPYAMLSVPYKWTKLNGNNVAWFRPEMGMKTIIFMYSCDTSAGKELTAGLDMIQIYAEEDDQLIPLIAVTDRCVSVFTEDILTIDLSAYYITKLISYYYEHNAAKNNTSAYYTLGSDSDLILSLTYMDGYFFQLSRLEGQP